MQLDDRRDVIGALADGSIRPWYQPVVDLSRGEPVGYEALARWVYDDRVLLPGLFMPLVSQSELTVELDLAIATRALDDLARWCSTSPGLRMALNFSGPHLDREGWAEELHRRVLESGVAPEQVDVELTETIRPRDLDQLASQLEWLRERGYSIWLDDFGVGWSGLAHVLLLGIDGLKIDRLIVSQIEGPGASVVRMVTGLARELDMRTVAEGLESPGQAERALDLACDLGQGWWFSRAVPASDVERVLAGG